MRGKRKIGLSLTAAALVAVLACFCSLGCSGERGKSSLFVSYRTEDSTVYSSTAELVTAVAGSVVEIRTESVKTQYGYQYVVSGAGSGVIIAHGSDYKSYLIVTNNHVIAGARDITVTLRSGRDYKAELVATDEAGDIAVVKIDETSTLNIARWGDSDDLQIGEDLIAIGNPLGSLGGTVTKGILSATERTITVGNYDMTLLQTDTAINPGNSGGGLFNMKGDLVGIVNAKTSDEEIEGICFAIPANTASAIVQNLVEYGYVLGRVSLGVEVEMYSGIPYVAAVHNVAPDTFALYDRIVSVGGYQVTSVQTFNTALSKLKPGEEVSVTVYRGELQRGFFGSAQLVFASQPTTFTVTADQLGGAFIA